MENDVGVTSEQFRRNLQERAWTVVLWVIAGVILCRVVAGTLLYVQPKLYGSIVVLEERPPPPVAGGAKLTVPSHGLRVISERLALPSRWGRLGEGGEEHEAISDEEAQHLAGKAIRIVRSRRGRSTEIRVRHRNAQDARDLAEACAHFYPGWMRWVAVNELPESEQEGLGEYYDLKRQWREARISRTFIEEAGEDPEAHARQLLQQEGGNAEDFLAREEARRYLKASERIKSLEGQIEKLEPGMAGINLPAGSEIAVVKHAEIGKTPVSPRVEFWMQVALVPGILLGVALWYFYLEKWRDPGKAAAIEKRKVEEFRTTDY